MQRREAHAELVDEQDLRFLDERAGHGEHLLLAARERAGVQVPALFECGEHLEHVARVGPRCGRARRGSPRR